MSVKIGTLNSFLILSNTGSEASRPAPLCPLRLVLLALSKEDLKIQLNSLEKKYDGKEIPRPEHWGGYIVKPISVEFWQGRPNRMHDRIRYSLTKDFSWKLERMAP